MTVIIGIDPGSRRTGYGIIRIAGNRNIYLASGYIYIAEYSLCERLRKIYLGLQAIVETFKPHEAAIEQVFMHENPNSALKLGQARGAAIVALDIPVSEYGAREVKKAIVGNGAANKDQVQFMVRRLLNIKEVLQADASDALAIALCHANSRQLKKLELILQGKR